MRHRACFRRSPVKGDFVFETFSGHRACRAFSAIHGQGIMLPKTPPETRGRDKKASRRRLLHNGRQTAGAVWRASGVPVKAV